LIYGNAAVVLIVIALVACVLGIVFAAMYFLDRELDSGTDASAGERKGATGETFRVHEIGKRPLAEERAPNVAQLRS
jgi:hypothetical protein